MTDRQETADNECRCDISTKEKCYLCDDDYECSCDALKSVDVCCFQCWLRGKGMLLA